MDKAQACLEVVEVWKIFSECSVECPVVLAEAEGVVVVCLVLHKVQVEVVVAAVVLVLDLPSLLICENVCS